MIPKRYLGHSGIEIGPMGLGCWAIGGSLWQRDGGSLGWGRVDDGESIQAIRRAIDLGITLFDTADVYGAGHSEHLLGQALAGQRHHVVIMTKFGAQFEEGTRTWLGYPEERGIAPSFVREACTASLKRLNTDYIDLYLFHWANYDADRAFDLLPILEDLVDEGKIRGYGWSTNDPGRARIFAGGEHCLAIEHHHNILQRSNEMVQLCKEHNLTSIARGPLAKGMLTGKFTRDTKLPRDDVRSGELDRDRFAVEFEMVDALRDILTLDGRSMTQAALGWLWASGDHIIPIPGFKNARQVEENVGAIRYGPLSDEQMQRVDRVLGVIDNPQKYDVRNIFG